MSTETTFTDRAGPFITVRDLKAWLATLPPEFEDAEIQSIVGRTPSTAKRLVAYRYDDGSGIGIYVNSMGTHTSDEHWQSIEPVAILH